LLLPSKSASALLALLLVIGVGLAGWDFLQLGRKIPEPVLPDSQADLVRVDKAARTLTLLRGANIIKTYPVSLGGAPEGQKSREGVDELLKGAIRLIPGIAAAVFT
jgi:murein L,D-transpeptidase YafK